MLGTRDIGAEADCFLQITKKKWYVLNGLKLNKKRTCKENGLSALNSHGLKDSKTAFLTAGHYLGPEI